MSENGGNEGGGLGGGMKVRNLDMEMGVMYDSGYDSQKDDEVRVAMLFEPHALGKMVGNE